MPTTTARRKKLLKPAEAKTPPEPALEADAVETVAEVAPADDGAHLADLVVPDLEDDTDDEDAPLHVDAVAKAVAAKADLIGKDAFFTVFKTAFVVPQIVLPDMAALAVQPNEEPAARAASDATYALLKIYYPAALTPKGEVLGNLMIAGPFFIGKALIVREVLRARRAKPLPPAPERAERPAEPTPPAANDNWPMDIEAVKMAATA